MRKSGENHLKLASAERFRLLELPWAKACLRIAPDASLCSPYPKDEDVDSISNPFSTKTNLSGEATGAAVDTSFFFRLACGVQRVAGALCLFFGTLLGTVQGQVYEKVFDFEEARSADRGSTGASPIGGLVQGTDGDFYGTTSRGGEKGLGTIFKITPKGLLTTLHEFQGPALNGLNPQGALVQGSDGNFYGTLQNGVAGLGSVFRVSPAGVFTTLVEFSPST